MRVPGAGTILATAVVLATGGVSFGIFSGAQFPSRLSVELSANPAQALGASIHRTGAAFIDRQRSPRGSAAARHRDDVEDAREPAGSDSRPTPTAVSHAATSAAGQATTEGPQMVFHTSGERYRVWIRKPHFRGTD